MFLFHVKWKLSLFLRKTITPQNGLLIFLWKETHSETKSWKSSKILTKKVTTTTVNHGNRRGFSVWILCFHFSFFFHHFFIFLFSFIFFHFFSFFHFFNFFHFLSFSFIFLHFPSFSFIFLHFLSFSFIF